MTSNAALLDVNALTVEFPLRRRKQVLRAVDGVSLTVAPRETVGLVGESGSGKTTIGRAILGLTPIASGSISFAGKDITRLRHAERRRLSADLQVVFQDPYSSLNPVRPIGKTLAETLLAHGKHPRTEVADRVRTMLERVGLPADAASRYPAHFSGGQRQRIAIARALMAQPRLVICDEPVSALDLSVQAQVLNLLSELQSDFGLSYLFIAHDLAVVRHISQRIVVLYRGRIVEEGDAKTVHDHPAHPYTQALLDSVPIPDPELQRAKRVTRVRRVPEVVSAVTQNGCAFAARCPYAIEICRVETPPLDATPEGQLVACHRWPEVASRPLPAMHDGLQRRSD